MNRITRKLWDWVDDHPFVWSERLWGRRTRNWHSLAFGLAIGIIWIIMCLALAAASIVTLLIDGAWWCFCRVPLVANDKLTPAQWNGVSDLLVTLSTTPAPRPGVDYKERFAGEDPERGIIYVDNATGPCVKCGEVTRYADIDFQAWVCGPKCHNQYIDEFTEAACGKMTIHRPRRRVPMDRRI